MTQSPAATRPRFFSSSMAALLKSAGSYSAGAKGTV
ncbi:Uncharacterised protein [Bordetella pertussis]|nr:Uncharacterised protein [Bordetella pertussis]